jgi:hypothetical protein
MSRPRLPIGSNGSISVKEVSPGVWRAITRYRFSNGKFRQVERRAASEAKARNALKRALLTIDSGVIGSISPDMRLSVLADRFMNEKRECRSVGTVQTYQVAVDAHIKPDIGELAIREATPERLGNFISLVAQDHGHGAAKKHSQRTFWHDGARGEKRCDTAQSGCGDRTHRKAWQTWERGNTRIGIRCFP